MGIKGRAKPSRRHKKTGAERSSQVTLSTLIADLDGARLVGDGSVNIGRVRASSREVQPGDLFVAVRGRSVDGHRFIGDAVARGACAVVVDRDVSASVPVVRVRSSAVALGHLAAARVGRPGDRLGAIGITGTNGKTTISYLVEAIVNRAGLGAGVIGTVSYRYGGRTIEAPYTTPVPTVLHDSLLAMENAGCRRAILEVSSAALEMDRLVGLAFDVAVFTNLTQDHLDVHGSMKQYREAKERLFRENLRDCGVAVINVDDPAGAAMVRAAGGRRVLRVSSKGADAEVRVVEARSTVGGIDATIETPRGPLKLQSSALIGHYNIDNCALAVAVGEAIGLDHADIIDGIASMDGVPGRVQRVPNDRGLDIFVDYAHTPDALENVLAALRPLTSRRLICVFGCGGDRDPTKREPMGQAASQGADLVVVTSDNPRTEDPRQIIDMILPAVPNPLVVDVDRRTAIHAAVGTAVPGDIVLIAGKGHEDYQILGKDKIHFDDREVAAEAAAQRWTFDLKDVLRSIDGQLVSGSCEAFSRITIDGRAAAPGDLYVAIVGERFDGHDFCAQAVDAGALGVVVARGRNIDVGDAAVIEVEDPRQALGQLARFHRRRWGGQLVAVTGSAGKTTTKDLISGALSVSGPVLTTVGSLNNETGVPLTLLGLRRYHRWAVIEMGMRGLGQIAYLAQLAEPDVGVVTNAGVAHVGVVGSVEDIARGKGEVFAHLRHGGRAVYPVDDPRLAAHARSAAESVTFGRDKAAAVRLDDYQVVGSAGSYAYITVGRRHFEVALPMVGQHNAVNATCAVAAAVALDLDPAQAIRGLESVQPADLRGEIRDVAGRHVLVDCYNANPASMQAALTTLAELSGGQRAFAVLGDMLELGAEATPAHREAGANAAKAGADLIALGEHGAELVAGAQNEGGRAQIASDAANAAELLLNHSQPGDWILIKASRGMKLERVVDAFRRVGGNRAPAPSAGRLQQR